jgi:very-short-patch-repair endonuclease
MADVEQLLARQLGLVTRAQALAAGLTSRQLDGARRGSWVRVHPAVYRHPAFPVTFEQRLLAGVLAAGAGCLVSHRAAVALHGLERFRCDVVELTVARRSIARVDGAIVHRHPGLTPSDAAVASGLPVTTPSRTLLDLGVVAGVGLVRRCLEEWLARGLLRTHDLDDALARSSGRPGVAALRRAWLDHGGAAPDSVAEAALARLLVRHGLPRPVHHLVVTTSSGRRYELDWAYPAQRIALEVDGYRVHARSARAFADDRLRANDLLVDGWLVLQFAPSTITRQPRRVLTQVAAALARRPTSRVAR